MCWWCMQKPKEQNTFVKKMTFESTKNLPGKFQESIGGKKKKKPFSKNSSIKF